MKGKFPKQSILNLRGVHEIDSKLTKHQKDAKAIMTLRGGKVVDKKVQNKSLQETSLCQAIPKDA